MAFPINIDTSDKLRDCICHNTRHIFTATRQIKSQNHCKEIQEDCKAYTIYGGSEPYSCWVEEAQLQELCFRNALLTTLGSHWMPMTHIFQSITLQKRQFVSFQSCMRSKVYLGRITRLRFILNCFLAKFLKADRWCLTTFICLFLKPAKFNSRKFLFSLKKKKCEKPYELKDFLSKTGIHSTNQRF